MTTPEATAPAPPVPTGTLAPEEKKHYLMALITLACSDQQIQPGELEIIKKAAKRLKFRLRQRDLRHYDLDRITDGIRRPSVRARLFEDLVRLARCDRKWSAEELRIIKHWGEHWEQPLPELPGLDWTTVRPPNAAEVEKISTVKCVQLGARRELLRAADPGFQWGWMFAAAGVYIVMAFVAGFLLAVLRLGEGPRPGQADATAVLLNLAVSWLAGLMIGKLSPGRTLREAAIGVCIPIVLISAWMLFRALEVAPAAVGTLFFVFSLATAIQYGATLFGAWVGEELAER